MIGAPLIMMLTINMLLIMAMSLDTFHKSYDEDEHKKPRKKSYDEHKREIEKNVEEQKQKDEQNKDVVNIDNIDDLFENNDG